MCASVYSYHSVTVEHLFVAVYPRLSVCLSICVSDRLSQCQLVHMCLIRFYDWNKLPITSSVSLLLFCRHVLFVFVCFSFALLSFFLSFFFLGGGGFYCCFVIYDYYYYFIILLILWVFIICFCLWPFCFFLSFFLSFFISFFPYFFNSRLFTASLSLVFVPVFAVRLSSQTIRGQSRNASPVKSTNEGS